MNIGSIFRSAHAFGASFVFTLNAHYVSNQGNKVDTSNAYNHLPFYEFPDESSLTLPHLCELVGIELMDEGGDLPSFKHPLQAAYILGPEKGSLSPPILKRCKHIVRIPTKFCINVGLAAAITMYDRMISLGRFSARNQKPKRHSFTPNNNLPNAFSNEQMALFRKEQPSLEIEEFLESVKNND